MLLEDPSCSRSVEARRSWVGCLELRPQGFCAAPEAEGAQGRLSSLQDMLVSPIPHFSCLFCRRPRRVRPPPCTAFSGWNFSSRQVLCIDLKMTECVTPLGTFLCLSCACSRHSSDHAAVPVRLLTRVVGFGGMTSSLCLFVVSASGTLGS